MVDDTLIFALQWIGLSIESLVGLYHEDHSPRQETTLTNVYLVHDIQITILQNEKRISKKENPNPALRYTMLSWKWKNLHQAINVKVETLVQVINYTNGLKWCHPPMQDKLCTTLALTIEILITQLGLPRNIPGQGDNSVWTIQMISPAAMQNKLYTTLAVTTEILNTQLGRLRKHCLSNAYWTLMSPAPMQKKLYITPVLTTETLLIIRRLNTRQGDNSE